jgi:transcription elongation GreA/GreB family factor
VSSTSCARTAVESERVGEARRDRDIADNPVLQDLLEEHFQLERRIALLEAWLGAAEVVEPIADGRTDMGSVVRVRDRRGSDVRLRPRRPARVRPRQRLHFVAAPVGQALMGQRAGDSVEVDAPRGRVVFEVVSVRPAAWGCHGP